MAADLWNKERLTWLSMARPHVSKARLHVSKMHDTRAIMACEKPSGQFLALIVISH
jgi:hypothetical protein